MNVKFFFLFAALRMIKGDILDLQPISQDTRDTACRQRWLVPAIELIKYSFVSHHQHGHISQKWSRSKAKGLVFLSVKEYYL